ncbi:hypothetical protein [Enterococcus alishanensis]|uniref:Uncharacterized protein n=1 Tax=Enterococcus alishanensis TaxID=1303817 RepID=A0ABS6TH55_9ENTE|nr:hypothetical protein [Enterococcus alishanensis]MBV7392216.1 hypothetical protein [Enterococcus alishanensis]
MKLIFLSFLVISFLVGFLGTWYFSERDGKYYKISLVTAGASLILFCAFFPTDKVIDHMSTIDTSDSVVKTDVYTTRKISHKNF